MLGYAYASRHRERDAYRWSVDLSAYVHEEHRGKGVGRSLYDRLIEVLVQQRFVNAFAGITIPNAPSVALHEAIGMTLVGVYRQVGYKFGAWHDVSWYGMRLWEPDGAAARAHPVREPVVEDGRRHTATPSSTARGVISSNIGWVLARST